MAFSKIAGFEVTPFNPSWTTRSFSSPETIKPRRILSYQGLCPNLANSTSGFTAVAVVMVAAPSGIVFQSPVLWPCGGHGASRQDIEQQLNALRFPPPNLLLLSQ